MTIGERIKSLRKKNKLTQVQLANKINVSSQVVSNWERGYTTPSADDIAKLSGALDVSSSDLLDKDRKEDNNNTLDEIKDVLDSLGISEIFFHNLDDWKNLSPEDIEEIKNHFQYIAHKAKMRNRNQD